MPDNETRSVLTEEEARMLIGPHIGGTKLLRDNLDENGSGSRSVKRRPVAKR